MPSNYPAPIPADLAKLATDTGYHVECRPLVHRRGWPQRSAKPYLLYMTGGDFLAAFATLKGLERNLRGRNGC